MTEDRGLLELAEEDERLLRDWATTYIGPDWIMPDGGYGAALQTLARVVLQMADRTQQESNNAK